MALKGAEPAFQEAKDVLRVKSDLEQIADGVHSVYASHLTDGDHADPAPPSVAAVVNR